MIFQFNLVPLYTEGIYYEFFNISLQILRNRAAGCTIKGQMRRPHRGYTAHGAPGYKEAHADGASWLRRAHAKKWGLHYGKKSSTL